MNCPGKVIKKYIYFKIQKVLICFELRCPDALLLPMILRVDLSIVETAEFEDIPRTQGQESNLQLIVYFQVHCQKGT